MAKQVTILALEGDALRGVQLDTEGESPVRASAESWSLVAAPVVEASTEVDDQSLEDNVEVTAEVSEADRPLARALREASAKFGVREFVLSIPLSRLLVKMVELPAEARDDLLGAAQLEMDGISPFPDEVLSVGAEIVSESDDRIVAAVAALPEAPSAELSEALAVAKVHVARTDITALGWLRGLWPRICERAGVSRRLVLMTMGGDWDLVVLDGDAPVFMRGIGSVATTAELVREVTLSVMQIGAKDDPCDVVVCSRKPVDGEVEERLGVFGSVRTVLVEDEFAGAEGAALRTVEDATLDITPDSWREARLESQYRRKTFTWLGVAVGVWLLLMLVLFGYDVVYGFRTSRQKAMQTEKSHRQALKTVTEMKDRVTLIERYADHARGALEVLKVVSDNLPAVEDMSFRQFQYRRGETVRVNGFAGQREDIRTFTENLEKTAFEGDEELMFEKVTQSGGETQTRNGIRFAIECAFKSEEDETSQKGGGR